LRNNMQSLSTLKAEELTVIQEAKRLANDLCKEMDLDAALGGRLTYQIIINELAEGIQENLRFSEKRIAKLIAKFSGKVVPNLEQVKSNPLLLDLLYEELVSTSYRKKFGQFMTPNYIAEFMASWINQSNPRVVLDPAVGTGIFLEKILQTSGSIMPEVWGFDTDPILLNACQIRLAYGGFPSNVLHLLNQDFIGMGSFFSPKVDGVICNPPYLNFHDFDRNGLVKAVEERLGVKLSRLTNIYVLFFLQSFSTTKKGSRLAFITPSEFLYTGYGEELKEFLLKNATIDSLILIDFENGPVFNKAITTAVITLFRNTPPGEKHKVKFIRIYSWPNAEELMTAVVEGNKKSEKYRIIEILQDKLIPKKKWLEYFVTIKNGHVRNKLVPLSQLAEINRGIATGFNNYFVMSKSEISKWNIEDKFIVPVISKAIQVKSFSFTKDDWNRLSELGEKVNLLYVFEEPSEYLRRYIKFGEDQVGANLRYLTKHRTPWYSMEKQVPAEILASVFHREEMRFILNTAKVRTLATFHCVYPKFKDITLIKALLAYLNSDLCRDMQTVSRREYGGGLHKFEPRDLENIPTLDVRRIKATDVQILANLFDELELASKDKDKDRERLVRAKLDSTLQNAIADT
jgi:adenine-specific DNA-methyltransferase